jgi:hypothetical protein
MVLSMCARRIASAGPFQQNVTLQARQERLTLPPHSVIIHRNGIEFRSPTAFAPWTEMTLTLQSPRDQGIIHCAGVVISCTGNRHGGYHVSMVFTSLSKQAQARLDSLAYSAAS